jgi:hypothetical protein
MNEWQLNHISPLKILSQLLRLKIENKLNKIIHFHGSFGDIYCQLSVYSETNEQEGNLLLIDPRYNLLILNVKRELDCIAFVDSNNLNLQFSKIGLLGNDKDLPIRLLPTLYPQVPELISNLNLEYSSFLRYLLDSKHINQFKQIEKRNNILSEIEQIFQENDLIKGKTIIFSPDNNTQIEFSNEFWNSFVDYVRMLNWIPVLNNSGDLVNNKTKFTFNEDVKRIKIPPHLAVSLPEYAGAYIGGTNGFQTIQALFNNVSKGIHLININMIKDKMLHDKFGNKIKLDTYLHSKTFKNEFLNKQNEILCKDKFDDYIKDRINEILL